MSLKRAAVLCVETNQRFKSKETKTNEMSKRRLSLPSIESNHPRITQYVERELKKDQPIIFIRAKRSSQSSETGEQTPLNTSSTDSESKKRTRSIVSSPDSSTERQPNKRQATNMSDIESTKNITAKEHVNLKPELQELKRQLFTGFEQLIEPLKKDIRDLKTERKEQIAALSVETVNRKFQRSEAKQKKIESRLSMIEDQLLGKKPNLPRPT